MITWNFDYVYCGLVYYKVYKDNVYQFTGTEEDINDYLELLSK